jgi:hypothetical protein
MPEPRPRRRGSLPALGSLLALLGSSGCFDPDPPRFETGNPTTGDDTTTGDPPVLDSSSGVVDPSVSTTSGSTGDPDDSSGTTAAPGTETDGTSSTGEPVVETSTGSEESSTGSEESSTGELPTDGYGDCENNPPAAVCQPSEACIDFGNVAYCAPQGCVTGADCLVPATGNALPNCTDFDGNGVTDCYLECFAGQICPDGMICYGSSYCMWTTFLPPGVCPDSNIGSAVPQTIMGDNTGLGDDHFLNCGTGGGEDAMYQFTAPVAGNFSFDTFGSPFDTMLAVLDGCGGNELTCNDDTMDLQSQVTVNLGAGQAVIIVVDGYGGATGPFTLNITQVP